MAGRPRAPRPAAVQRTGLGAILRDMRQAAGLTQAALADRIGVTATYISSIERGGDH